MKPNFRIPKYADAIATAINDHQVRQNWKKRIQIAKRVAKLHNTVP
jgi:hypothetical protein